MLWIGTGLALDLDGRLYIALGIPFVIAFQLVVRRRPLRDLWVRDGDSFRLDRRGRRIAAVLVIYPVIAMAIFLLQSQWLNAMMAGCAVPGAFAAAYALRRQDTRLWHPALRAALLATVIGLGWMVALIVPAIDADAYPRWASWSRGLHSLLLYLPVAFVLEEVAFRGAVDAHVHRPGESWGWLERGLRLRAVGAVAHPDRHRLGAPDRTCSSGCFSSTSASASRSPAPGGVPATSCFPAAVHAVSTPSATASTPAPDQPPTKESP